MPHLVNAVNLRREPETGNRGTAKDGSWYLTPNGNQEVSNIAESAARRSGLLRNHSPRPPRLQSYPNAPSETQ